MSKTYGNFTDFVDFSRSSSATYLGSDGLIKTAANNIPRVEYDANGVVKGLLIEEARTNLIAGSDGYTGWNNGGSLSSTTSMIFLNGNYAAEYEVDSGATVYYAASVTASTTYTFSWFFKEGTATTRVYAFYDQTNGAFVGLKTEYGPEDAEYYGDGWYRMSATVTTPVGCTTLRVYPLRGQGESGSPAGVLGTTYISAAQLEKGSFPTSHIPTTGATATRAADIASIATANFGYNKGAGTVVVNFDNLKFGAGGSGFPRPVELGSSAHAGERINFYVAESSGNFAFGINTANAAQAGGTLVASTTSPVGPYKAGIAYKKDNVAAVETGGDVLTDTSADISGVVYSRDTLKIGGSTIATTHQVNGHIKSIKYLPRRLTNTQLQEQTA